jgi:ribosomal protein L30/L7E
MSIAVPTVLTEAGSTSNASSYTTASVTLTAGRLYLVGIHKTVTTGPATDPTGIQTTGGAVVFAKAAAGQGYNSTGTPLNNLTWWWVIPASTVTATIAITAGTATGCAWKVIEITSGFSSSAIVTTSGSALTTAATSATFTPTALNKAANMLLALWGVNLNLTTDVASGTSWTNLGTGASYNTPTTAIETAYNAGGSSTQLTMSGAGSALRGYQVVEIRAGLVQPKGETVGVTEAKSAVPGRVKMVAETLGLSDAISAAKGWVLQFGEYLNVTESPSRVLNFFVAPLVKVRNESVALAEATLRSLGLRRSVNETESVTEASATFRGLVRRVAETVNIADTLTTAKGWVLQVGEYLNVTESLGHIVASGAAGLVRVLNEAIGLSESTNRFLGILRSAAESIAVTEATGTPRGLRRTQGETVGVTESASTTRGILRTISEVLGIADTLSTARGWVLQVGSYIDIVETRRALLTSLTGAIIRAVNETLAIVEGSTSPVQHILILLEDIGLTEAVAKFRGIARVRTETLGLTETRARILGATRAFSESISILETRVRKLGLVRRLTESVAITETPRRIATFIRRVAETVGVTEGSRRLVGLVRRIAESVGLTEATVRVLTALGDTLVKIRNEAIALTEAAIQVTGFVRQRSENVAITETTSKARGLRRVVAELLGITESTRRVMSLRRLIGEAIAVTEGRTTHRSLLRLLTETVSVVEVAQRAAKFVRVRAETVNVQETARPIRGLFKIISATIGLAEALLKYVRTAVVPVTRSNRIDAPGPRKSQNTLRLRATTRRIVLPPEDVM